MYRVIIVKDKYSTYVMDAKTPEAELKSFRKLFDARYADYYVDMRDFRATYGEYPSRIEVALKTSYDLATAGDDQAAKTFILARSRNSYEYEHVEIVKVKEAEDV